MADSDRHIAQVADEYRHAIWAGDADAALILNDELDRLERERVRALDVPS